MSECVCTRSEAHLYSIAPRSPHAAVVEFDKVESQDRREWVEELDRRSNVAVCAMRISESGQRKPV